MPVERVQITVGKVPIAAIVGYLSPTEKPDKHYFDLTAREQGAQLQTRGEQRVVLCDDERADGKEIYTPHALRNPLEETLFHEELSPHEELRPIDFCNRGALYPVVSIREIKGQTFVKLVYVVGTSSQGGTIIGAEGAIYIGNTLYCVAGKGHSPITTEKRSEGIILSKAHCIPYQIDSFRYFKLPSLMQAERLFSEVLPLDALEVVHNPVTIQPAGVTGNSELELQLFPPDNDEPVLELDDRSSGPRGGLLDIK